VETFDIQDLHKMHQACSNFMISLQAESAVTADVKFRANLEQAIRELMPMELRAHTWRSALYYR
jgi:hypothetical protein